MKQIVSGNIKCFDISCSAEDVEKSMNKPIGIKCADIYLRFPEIMKDEANDLADFLEDEHIVYEGATDVFMEKDKEIERLNNIINELEKDLKNKIEENRLNILSNPHWLYCLDKLKELKESGNNE